jgi:WD40 repeat protein
MKAFRNPDTNLLYERQIIPKKYDQYRRIGFSKGIIKSFTRFDCDLEHYGCVNTVKWNKTGDILMSGSDDRTIKLWSLARNLETVSLVHTIQTKHRGNIFCVDLSPENPNCLMSAAADGTLKCSYIDTKHAGTNVFSSEDIM